MTHLTAPAKIGLADPPNRSAAIESSEAPLVSVRALRKHFRREDRTTVPAIDAVSLDVRRGEVLVLLGPSGCGKTTLLRAVAGLERPDAGRIAIAGRTVFDSDAGLDAPPEARRISMIFQSYALWPHMSAGENVAYPLRSRGAPAREIETRAREALRLVGIPELFGQYPGQMSGGQQQRVALARAIVSRDDLILFDEPLSNVDAKVRQQLRLELLEMQRKLGFGAIYVTHDQIEAMALAHRIAVLRAGKIEQIGTGDDIYNRPASRYVANFIGATNEIPATVVSVAGGEALVESRFGRFAAKVGEARLSPGDSICVLTRPEHCRIARDKPRDGLAWRGQVSTSVFLGPYTETVVRVGDLAIQVWGDHAAPLPAGADVWIAPDAARMRIVPA